MKTLKVWAGIVYAVLFYMVFFLPLTMWAQVAQGTLVVIVAVHFYQCIFFREVIKDAPGVLWHHVCWTMIFGYFHVLAMKESIYVLGGKKGFYGRT